MIRTFKIASGSSVWIGFSCQVPIMSSQAMSKPVKVSAPTATMLCTIPIIQLVIFISRTVSVANSLSFRHVSLPKHEQRHIPFRSGISVYQPPDREPRNQCAEHQLGARRRHRRDPAARHSCAKSCTESSSLTCRTIGDR